MSLQKLSLFIIYLTRSVQSVKFHYFGHVNIIGHVLLVAILAVPLGTASEKQYPKMAAKSTWPIMFTCLK